MITFDRVDSLIDYNKKSGCFLWKKDKARAKTGCVAGYINSQGYRILQIDGKLLKASRVAFLLTEGYWPEHEMDHKDRVRDNDKWDNLRHVSRQCNVRNQGISNKSKTGVTGVCWDNNQGKWRAYISINKVRINLGYYIKLASAVFARWEAEKENDWPNCCTISTSYLYLKKRRLL